MQFKVDRLQNKLDCKSCVGKNNEKDKCEEEQNGEKKHREGETVNQRGGVKSTGR